MRIEGIGKPPGCKLIRINAEVEGGLIRSIRIRGDFFASPEEGFDRVEQGLRDASVSGVAEAFDRLMAQEGVEAFGIDGAGLASVLAGALEKQGEP
jgi:lipoate-protein ligase A